jgi:hypothetical protein
MLSATACRLGSRRRSPPSSPSGLLPWPNDWASPPPASCAGPSPPTSPSFKGRQGDLLSRYARCWRHPTSASQNETPSPGMAGASSRSTASAAHTMFKAHSCSVSALSFHFQRELHAPFHSPQSPADQYPWLVSNRLCRCQETSSARPRRL